MPRPRPFTAKTSGLGNAVQGVDQAEEAVLARDEVGSVAIRRHLEQVGAGAEGPARRR